MHAPPLRLMIALTVLLLAGQGLGWCQSTIDCKTKAPNAWSHHVQEILCLVQAREALAKANDAMFKLQSKDSLFLAKGLAVNTVEEHFQVDQIPWALEKLKAARDDTGGLAHERADRLSRWTHKADSCDFCKELEKAGADRDSPDKATRGKYDCLSGWWRDGDASADSVCNALNSIEVAIKKLIELQKIRENAGDL
jgi:hypothetical protein